MSNIKVQTTDQEISAALRLANEDDWQSTELRVVKAIYEPKQDRLHLEFNDGVGLFLPRKRLQGLEHASAKQLSETEIRGSGTGLSWPQLNVDHYVPGLLHGIYGTQRWMSQLGQKGGASRSLAKQKAARKNGSKGGRPAQATK